MTPARATGSEPKPPRPATLRPRDAASIMLLDRVGGRVHVLMGRRHSAHAFMPDLYVFPGGRRDTGDHRIGFGSDLHPSVLRTLKVAGARGLSDARARALALAALRELYEEAGIAIGAPLPSAEAPVPFLPDLAKLRYMARAITPPGNTRRFDTRFFAVFADEAEIDPTRFLDSRELQDLQWIDVNATPSLRIPDITAVILADLRNGLDADPSLPCERPVPLYTSRHGRFVRTLL
ncbi:NUDIX domain-containing protein [Ensifer sp. PDNC004]|uniref:NUDIX domain-containing protein n=1 Tax=Ensifer sp. PDNC004 TaxID=2811423 RepID=UPI001962A5F6|nr:NUDIX hydrolase [Ensifer sp. PDNC004]QRY69568.1 NUDIX domain-containing protein [Ensifer sp. PDNC004]